MELCTLCERISMPGAMTEKVMAFSQGFDFTPVMGCMEGLLCPDTAQSACVRLGDWLGDDPLGVGMLSCQLLCACRVYDRYRERGIPESIYFATMGCFTRFVVECTYYKGSFQFDRGWWTWRQLSMRVFRLGELEYELKDDGTVGMHIPSDARFAPDLVARSVSAAKAFLSDYEPVYADADLTCRSWLLSPFLGELLDDSSNIRAFQRLFDIREVDAGNMDYIPWLFRCIPGTPVEDYPRETSLQRKARELLLSGGSIGIAFGVLISE